MYTYKQLSTLFEVNPEKILTHVTYQDDQLKVTLLSLAAEQELKQHTASKPAILQIIQGEAVLGLGENLIEAKSGDWIHMPASLPHSVKAVTDLHFTLTLLK